MSALIQISRSAVVTRKLCPTKRWWGYHASHPDHPPETQVGGISPVTDRSGFAKSRGIWLHHALEKAIRGEDWIDPVMADIATAGLSPELTTQWQTLVRRATHGWMAVRGAILLADYTPISAEAEWEWSLSPFISQSMRMDQIWRRTSDGRLLIVDFKTLSRPDANWIERLRHSDQTHTYLQALTERTQEQLLGLQYEGILLGSPDEKTGLQRSPFVSGYRSVRGLSPTYTPGSRSEALPDTMTDDEWRDWVTPTVLANLYCTTGPLHPPSNQLLQTKAATAHAELQWADIVAQVEADPTKREALIERNADACLKFGWGYACPYMELCWSGFDLDDTFAPREDHHAKESPV